MVKQERALSSKLDTSPDHSSSVKYKGVRKRKWGKYVTEIRLPNSRERIWLGSYDKPEKAARAFDAALFCLRGNTANFNFPDQPPQIPGGRSLLPSQIQAAAARFANHYYSDINSADNSSTCNSSDQEESLSPSVVSQLTTDLQGETWTSPFLQEDDFTSSSSYMNIFDHTNINSTNTNLGVPDFGIFPGFDDYFMTTPLPATDDYGEENCDGIYLQDPSILWNF